MPTKSLFQDADVSYSPTDSIPCSRIDSTPGSLSPNCVVAPTQRKLKERMLSCLEKDRTEEISRPDGIQATLDTHVLFPFAKTLADNEDAVIRQSFMMCKRIEHLVGKIGAHPNDDQ